MKTLLLLFSLIFISSASHAQLNAEFTWCPVFDTTSQLCCIQFLDQSTDTGGIIISYMYDFGDGAVGTQKDPRHCYFFLGTYIVTEIVTDNSGFTDTVYHSIAITHLDSTGCDCNFIGVYELAGNLWNIQLSPNPFHSSTIISWNIQQTNMANAMQFNIYSIAGALLRKTIFTTKNGKGEGKIERGDLTDGMYFYEIRQMEIHDRYSHAGKELIGKGKFVIE